LKVDVLALASVLEVSVLVLLQDRDQETNLQRKMQHNIRTIDKSL